MRPWSMTIIRSACLTVLRRWAMTRTVRPTMACSSAACTSASLSVSRAEVASSSSSRRGSCRTARAMATRCFCPPDSWMPRSPTCVSYLSGSLDTKLCALATMAAFSTARST
mmetsp:Transcript_36303/g.61197  ORF Transcript_36303/g.61197 Transcript_36303/m.61197 type:complete len:112 (+) Transcript_36303:443-778(+)